MSNSDLNILYVSSMFDDETYQRIFTKDKKPMHAANKYHTLLCIGLAKNGAKVNTYALLPANRENCDYLYVKAPTIKGGNVTTKYISFFNFPGLKHIQVLLKSFLKALCASRNTVVLYDVLVVSASLGAVLGARLTGKKTIGIVTDLPKFQPISNNKRILKINEKLMYSSDGYVFLTEQMNAEVNLNNKPYIVAEGHVDSDMAAINHIKAEHTKKIVLYAGSLKKIYGISRLCEAFVQVSKPEEELHIYGDGDYVPELLEFIKNNRNVVFYGNRPNAEVVNAELHAYLLVNPRPTEGEYTKYSFPSKTLEYMVSGTPVLSAKLPGIPTEYDDYLFYFDDKDPLGMQIALRKILDTDAKELTSIGQKARDFVLKNKNNVCQAGRIIELIKRL